MIFDVRHPGPELMDSQHLPEEDLYLNYRELHTINRFLGGYRITLKGLARLATGHDQLSILDVGCGGGDMLKVVSAWGKRNHIKLQLTGVDTSDAAIDYARQNNIHLPEIEFLQADVFQHLGSGKRYDIIMNTLFMHHFTDEQIITLLRLMKSQAAVGFVVNDLERNRLAYHSIKGLTALFSRSYLVKHDAPVSVLRGFHEEEWWYLLSRALIATAEISWEWAFRYLLIYKTAAPAR